MTHLACEHCLVRKPCELDHPDGSEAADVRLVARFLCHDPRATNELLHRLEFVRRIIVARNDRMGHPWREPDIDDLAQETVARILQGIRRFEGRSTIETWAARIAELVVMEAFRARRRGERARESSLFALESLAHRAEDPEAGDGIVPSTFRARRGPREDLRTRRAAGVPLVDDLASVFGELPRNERRVVDLHVRLELTFEEVGSVLGVPIGTVKTRYYRAIDRMRRRLVPTPTRSVAG
ncbi:MAG: RNA polymerase sigma factor [Planctomycetota bacterium]